MPWEYAFLIIFAGFVLLLDRDIDPYPTRFPESKTPRREIIVICILWGLALIVNALR